MRSIFVVCAVAMLLAGCGEPKPAPDVAKPTAAKPEAKKAASTKVAEAKSEIKPNGAAKEEPGAKPSSQPAANMPSTGHFGAAFTMKESQPLKAIFDKSSEFADKTVKVEGTVRSVCKKKGCWFVLQTDEAVSRDVRITMKDYGFFAPKDCSGKKAVVEGVFSRTLVKEATRKHLAEDGGTDPNAVKGDAEEYRLVATGLEIKG